LLAKYLLVVPLKNTDFYEIVDGFFYFLFSIFHQKFHKKLPTKHIL
jgi:hypothetical protein